MRFCQTRLLLGHWICLTGLICSLSVTPAVADTAGRNFLTAQESAWIDLHAAEVRIAPEINYPPFSFVEAGAWQGLSADLIQLIQDRLGVKFQTQAPQNLDTILGKARQGNVDIITSLKDTPERSQYLSFTSPYFKVPAVVIMRSAATQEHWPDSFFGESVTVGKGYGVQRYLEQNFSSIHLSLVSDDLEGLRKLSFGETNAVIMDVASASFFIGREKFTNLRVVGELEFTYDLSFAVRKDLPVLREILAKTLTDIPAGDKQAILNKWVQIDMDPASMLLERYRRWLPVGAVVFLSLLSVGIIGWAAVRGRQKTTLAAAQYARSLIEASLDPLVTISAEGKITDVNEASIQVTGVAREALIGSDFTNYFTDPAQAREGYLQVFAQGFVTDYPLAIRHASGTITDVLYNASIYRDESGKVLGVFAAARDITERKKAEDAIRLVSQYSRSLLEASLDPLVTISAEGKITDVNKATELVTGVGRTEMVGSDFANYFTDPKHAREGYQQVFAKGFVTDYALAIRHTSGRITDVLYNASVYRDEAGNVLGVFAAARDITERKKAEGYIQAASVFTFAREGIIITSADGTILNVNESFTRITGYSRDEAVGKNPSLLASGRQDKEFYTSMWRDLIEKGHWYGEIWNRRRDGEIYVEMLTITAVRDAAGKTERYVALFTDISAIKEHQNQLEYMAHFDALTRLPNRLLLADRMRQGLAQAQRRGAMLAVVYLDLDGFKKINDQYGHETGDKLLIAVAARMKQSLREGDTLARIGGDEFAAVLTDIVDASGSVPLLKRILDAAAEPAQLGQHTLQVTASLGVAFFPQAQSVDAEQLMRQADQAMYQAKLAGKNRYHVFDAEQDSGIRVRQENLQRIEQALYAGEFVLHYQPKVNMRDGTVIGFEALIRWRHPERGLLAPSEFLPVFEDHPLAISIGEWVIDTALRQVDSWSAQGLRLPVSVNVGARQLQQVDFKDRLRAILSVHPQVHGSWLELEIVETSALNDVSEMSRLIDSCAQLGVGFALDDFGTGYSSLTYLKRLGVSMIKIDQSFVRDMLSDPDDMAILRGVISLATVFKRQVIAEGVETLEHGRMLLQLGCDLAQGYGIARPMPADEMPAWVKAWPDNLAWQALSKVKSEVRLLL